MSFDWQAELAIPSIPSLASMKVDPPPAKTVNRISFEQAMTAEPITSSNDNLPQPVIRGENVSIKILQQIYEKGTTYCKRILRGATGFE
jgi:hypothetical protein